MFWALFQDQKEDKETQQREAMQAIIQDFLNDPKATVHHCAPCLTSYERMLLHELAEQSGQLNHNSQGDGKSRHIVLEKKEMSSATSLIKEGKVAEGAGEVGKKKTLPNVVCSTCAKEVPKANIDLHKLKCTPIQGELHK